MKEIMIKVVLKDNSSLSTIDGIIEEIGENFSVEHVVQVHKYS